MTSKMSETLPILLIPFQCVTTHTHHSQLDTKIQCTLSTTTQQDILGWRHAGVSHLSNTRLAKRTFSRTKITLQGLFPGPKPSFKNDYYFFPASNYLQNCQMKPAPSDNLSTHSSPGVSWVLGTCNKFHSTPWNRHRHANPLEQTLLRWFSLPSSEVSLFVQPPFFSPVTSSLRANEPSLSSRERSTEPYTTATQSPQQATSFTTLQASLRVLLTLTHRHRHPTTGSQRSSIRGVPSPCGESPP